MLTVFMLNMCYDVPVKLMSLHFLVMALLLIAPDAPRLAGVLFFDRRVEPVRVAPLFARRWLDRAPHAALFLFGLWSMLHELPPRRQHVQGASSAEPAAVRLVVGGGARPRRQGGAGAAVPSRWRWVQVTSPGFLSVQCMDGSWERYALSLDRERKSSSGSLGGPQDERPGQSPGGMLFRRPDPDTPGAGGGIDGHPARARLRKAALLSGRFHWISE